MVPFDDRRERAIAAVQAAYLRGSLSTATFERRVDASLSAASPRTLRDQLWDLQAPRELLDVATTRARYLLDVITASIPAIDASVGVDLSEVLGSASHGTWTLGRSDWCDVTLVQSRSVSRVHADLAFRDGVWRLRDRGSSNGVWIGSRRVDSVRVDPKVPVRLGGLEIWWSLGR